VPWGAHQEMSLVGGMAWFLVRVLLQQWQSAGVASARRYL
jgi:hypothetical protein